MSSRTLTAETLVNIFESLIDTMGSTNIFEPNPFVSTTFIAGPCDGVSLIAFQFYYDAVCPHIAALGEAPSACCESSSSSSSSSSLPITGQRLLQMGVPTRTPKLVVTVAELASSSSSSSASSSSSSTPAMETVDMLLLQGETPLSLSIPYTSVRDVLLWAVSDSGSASFIAADGSHDSSAHNLYLISNNDLSNALLANSPCQFVDPGLSDVDDPSISDAVRQTIANRIGGWSTSMAAMWPGVEYILQGNIAAPIKVSSGGSMKYWSQIHGSARLAAYSAMRAHLFDINRNAESYSVNYSSPVDYNNPVVLGKVRNSLDLAGAREHVDVVASLMFDMFEMIGGKNCQVAIDPILAYGVQMQSGDPVAFYVDVGINGVPASQARGVGYAFNNPVPWLISPSQVAEIAAVFRSLGIPVRMQLPFHRHAWRRIATTETVVVGTPVDTPSSSPEYEILARETSLFMSQYLMRRFFKEMLGEAGDPAGVPPTGYPSWQNAALKQRITELMDDLAVEYIRAIRGI